MKSILSKFVERFGNLKMINYKKGNLFDNIPKQNRTIVIPHICNNIGAWGSGFVLPLAEAYPISKQAYLARHNTIGLTLGEIQCPLVDEGIYVVNMVAQEGISSRSTGDRSRVNSKPIRYGALCKCLETINRLFKDSDIYAPKFGSGLARGNWEFIEELIDEILVDVRDIYIFSL
jgi:hypothetical protein